MENVTLSDVNAALKRKGLPSLTAREVNALPEIRFTRSQYRRLKHDIEVDGIVCIRRAGRAKCGFEFVNPSSVRIENGRNKADPTAALAALGRKRRIPATAQ